MRKLFLHLSAVLLVGLVFTSPLQAADNYTLDAVHSSVSFKIQHLGISWIHGRFNEVSGKFSINTDRPSKSSFSLTIQPASIDTGNKKRDGHLSSPDFFNVKQFPRLTFKSTSVKFTKDFYEVTGDLTMHGVTKSITFSLNGGKSVEFPKGVKRIGFSTDLILKRSAFGMNKMLPAIGDEVHVSIAFEGVKQ
jgi:polyisoprenoid-binding protein YceI